MSQLAILRLLALLVMLGLSVSSDLKERRIPNRVTGFGLLAGLVIGAFLEGGLPVEALSGAALALLLGFVIFALGGFGAGDAKLFAAVGAFVGPGGLFSVLAYAALTGGVLAMIYSIRRGAILGHVANLKNLILHWITMARAGHRTSLNRPESESIPYGVAIAAGAVLALIFPLSLRGFL